MSGTVNTHGIAPHPAPVTHSDGGVSGIERPDAMGDISRPATVAPRGTPSGAAPPAIPHPLGLPAGATVPGPEPMTPASSPLPSNPERFIAGR
jgi:hypothetical protein